MENHIRSLKYLQDFVLCSCPLFYKILFNGNDEEIVPLIVTIEEKMAYSPKVKQCLEGLEGAGESATYVYVDFMPALRRVLKNKGSFSDLALVKKRFPLYERVCASGNFGIIAVEA